MKKPETRNYGVTEDDIRQFQVVFGKIDSLGMPAIVLGIAMIGFGGYLALGKDIWWGIFLIVGGACRHPIRRHTALDRLPQTIVPPSGAIQS